MTCGRAEWVTAVPRESRPIWHASGTHLVRGRRPSGLAVTVCASPCLLWSRPNAHDILRAWTVGSWQLCCSAMEAIAHAKPSSASLMALSSWSGLTKVSRPIGYGTCGIGVSSAYWSRAPSSRGWPRQSAHCRRLGTIRSVLARSTRLTGGRIARSSWPETSEAALRAHRRQ